MRNFVLGFVAAVFVLVPGASALQQPGVIRITNVRLTQQNVAPGRVSKFLLYNKRLTPRHIGREVLTCWSLGSGGGPYPASSRYCIGVYQIGEDSIMVHGNVYDAFDYKLAVVGGTGRYNNIGGELRVLRYATRPVRENLTFRLTI